MKITEAKLAKWQRACDRAEPPPWKVATWTNFENGGWTAIGPIHEVPAGSEDDSEPGCPTDKLARRDARFIALARIAMPALIAEVRRLNLEIEKVKAWP